MCETVAEIAGLDNPISYLIAGLLSHLDALTGIAMPDLMANVALKQEIKGAILDGAGTMGTVLREVESYQNGDFCQLTTLSARKFNLDTVAESIETEAQADFLRALQVTTDTGLPLPTVNAGRTDRPVDSKAQQQP